MIEILWCCWLELDKIMLIRRGIYLYLLQSIPCSVIQNLLCQWNGKQGLSSLWRNISLT